MKRIGLILLAPLLLMAFSILPSGTQARDNSICEKDCKNAYKQCVKDTDDRPLCEAGYAFCLECCTGGC